MSKKMDRGREWFRLFSVKGLGPKRLHWIHAILASSGADVAEILRADWSDFQRLLPEFNRAMFDAIQELDVDQVQREYDRLIDEGVTVIHLGHEDYPETLRQRLEDSAPPLLFCKGNTRLLQSPGIAIVGSRNASEKGLALASHFAGELARRGKNVISGYARGVDTAAHLGALKEDGTTSIVLSSGILDFSPRTGFEDVDWKQSVLGISQFHPGERWSARNAMIRNKLVCGLAQAVLVIEAAKEKDERGKMSGTFDAGKTALQMGIPLFVLSPQSLGCSPEGNQQLIDKGGIEVNEQSAVATILGQLPEPARFSNGEKGTRQRSLFPE
jgi:DNA processing protein